MRPHIYLAGPVLGCNIGEANDWRDDMRARLASIGMVGVSPLRCEPLIGERYEVGYEDPMFGTAEAIASKNFLDVQRCDLTLAFFPKDVTDTNGPSLGTVVELAWAKAMAKPTILVSEHPKLRAHPVIKSCAGWRLDNLDQAMKVIEGVLAVYTPEAWPGEVILPNPLSAKFTNLV